MQLQKYGPKIGIGWVNFCRNCCGLGWVEFNGTDGSGPATASDKV